MNQPDTGTVSLLRLVLPLAKYKWRIVFVGVLGAVAGLALSYRVPDTFTASVRLLPPQTNSNTATVLLGQVGGTTSIGSSALGIKNPGDLYAGILKSRAILRPVTVELKLLEAYKVTTVETAEKNLRKNLKVTSGKDGILEIEITDTKPERAAKIGNALIDSLYRLSRQLTTEEAKRREEFHRGIISRARAQLNTSEDALLALEKSSGISRIKGHEESLSAALAEMQGLIATKEIEIASLKRFATESNTDLVTARKQLKLLRSKLAEMKQGPGEMGSISIAANQDMSSGVLPLVEKLSRLRRDVKLHETVLETAIRVAEASRVDEQRDLSIIQVLDRAVVPEVKSGPQRKLAAIFGLIGGVLAGVILVLAADAIMSNEGRKKRWKTLLAHLRIGRKKQFERGAST
jgi:tyrosine-protein kinase Etk/Wzc